MKCPHCGEEINAAAMFASQGGSATSRKKAAAVGVGEAVHLNLWFLKAHFVPINFVHEFLPCGYSLSFTFPDFHHNAAISKPPIKLTTLPTKLSNVTDFFSLEFNRSFTFKICCGHLVLSLARLTGPRFDGQTISQRVGLFKDYFQESFQLVDMEENLNAENQRSPLPKFNGFCVSILLTPVSSIPI